MPWALVQPGQLRKSEAGAGDLLAGAWFSRKGTSSTPRSGAIERATGASTEAPSAGVAANSTRFARDGTNRAIGARPRRTRELG